MRSKKQQKMVTYTVRFAYLVENHRQNWKSLELMLSERLSEMAEAFVLARIELFKDQRPYDLTYSTAGGVTDEQAEAAWDQVWQDI